MYGTVKDDRRLPFLQAASCSQVLSSLLRHWALIPFKDVREGERRLPFLQAASCTAAVWPPVVSPPSWEWPPTPWTTKKQAHLTDFTAAAVWALIPFKDVRDGERRLPFLQAASCSQVLSLLLRHWAATIG